MSTIFKLNDKENDVRTDLKKLKAIVKWFKSTIIETINNR